jgi:hypothetical protein
MGKSIRYDRNTMLQLELFCGFSRDGVKTSKVVISKKELGNSSEQSLTWRM